MKRVIPSIHDVAEVVTRDKRRIFVCLLPVTILDRQKDLSYSGVTVYIDNW